jgi:hypothetical protein
VFLNKILRRRGNLMIVDLNRTYGGKQWIHISG